MLTGEFSVYQFFDNGMYEAVARFVSDEYAVKRAFELTKTIGAKRGIVQRIIITDGGDLTVFEWQYGKGVVFPPLDQENG